MTQETIHEIARIATIIIVIGGLLYAIRLIIRVILNPLRRIKNNVLSVSEMVNTVKTLDNEYVPEERSVPGATNLYLPMILKDFPDFHNEEAVSSIVTGLSEYLTVAYCGGRFIHANVTKNLETMVQKYGKEHTVSSFNHHKTAIVGYEKTKEYATITYQSAIGYILDGIQKEDRYKTSYTYKLMDNGIASKSLRCPTCGGALGVSDVVCPFCGTRIIKDTYMSWKITQIEKS